MRYGQIGRFLKKRCCFLLFFVVFSSVFGVFKSCGLVTLKRMFLGVFFVVFSCFLLFCVFLVLFSIAYRRGFCVFCCFFVFFCVFLFLFCVFVFFCVFLCFFVVFVFLFSVFFCFFCFFVFFVVFILQ